MSEGWRKLVLALVALVVLESSALAQHGAGAPADSGPEALRLVLRLDDSAESAELLNRVQGQTGDLDVTITALDEPPLEATSNAQLASARTIAGSAGAAAVIWVDAASVDSVLVYLVQGERLLAHTVQTQTGEASALFEAAAVLVRSLVTAMLAGGEIGMEAPASEATATSEGASSRSDERAERVERNGGREVEAAPATGLAAPPAAQVEAGCDASESLWGVRVSMGWQIASDGVVGHDAVALAAGARYRELHFGVLGTLGLPEGHVDPITRLTLRRHTLAAYAAASYRIIGPLTFDPRLALGAAFLERETTALASGVLPTPTSLSALAYISAEVGISIRLPFLSGAISIGLTAGLDTLLPRTTLTYASDGEVFLRNELWVVQPRVGLSAILDLR